MKFAVIGGTGLVGLQVVKNLIAAGHEAASHSQSTGVDVSAGRDWTRRWRVPMSSSI